MKLNRAERWLVNNSVRALVQRFYEAPLLLRLGGAVQGGRVLEVGCGRGTGLPILIERFRAAHVIGIDIDPSQIARARKLLASYADTIDVAVASVEQLPFIDACFDAVFDFGMLHHVPSWQSGVAEIRRVLKPGGTFFFEEVTSAALDRWLYRTLFEHPRENRFNETDFLRELVAHGLMPNPSVHHALFGDIFIGVAECRGNT